MKAKYDIEVYDDYGSHTWAQAKYLVHGLKDVLWTNDTEEVLAFLRDNMLENLVSDIKHSIPDRDNYDYLRGFVDGYGGPEPHDIFPEGFKDINEVINRMFELKGNKT